jgi:hypothetical protein
VLDLGLCHRCFLLKSLDVLRDFTDENHRCPNLSKT